MSLRLSFAAVAAVLAGCSISSPPRDVRPAPASPAAHHVVAPLRNELTNQPSSLGWTDATTLTNATINTPIRYSFAITREGTPITAFEVSHEKLLHLIVVRNDLRHFQHLHPELDAVSGQFTVSFAFPEHGTFALFADFAPDRGEPTVLRKDVTIGAATIPAQLSVDDGAQTAGSYVVTPSVQSPIPAGQGQIFLFGITKDGQPVSDLQNYLGAKGHAVILKERTLEYLHAHPSDHGGGHGGMLMPGPAEVMFETNLTSPGRYRVFQQYRPEGQLITVANTYEVTSPPNDVSNGISETDVPMQEIAVEAFQWGYSPNVIRVRKGSHVMLLLTTRDVAHGFNLPDFDVSETILPGQMTMTTFTADKTGTFLFGCDIACGEGHVRMSMTGGSFIVE